MTVEGQYKIQYIRLLILDVSFKVPLLSGNTDAFIAISNPDDDFYVAAMQVENNYCNKQYLKSYRNPRTVFSFLKSLRNRK